MTIGKLLDRVSIVALIVFCVWMAASFIDVFAHQYSGGTSTSWNLFVMLVNTFGK